MKWNRYTNKRQLKVGNLIIVDANFLFSKKKNRERYHICVITSGKSIDAFAHNWSAHVDYVKNGYLHDDNNQAYARITHYLEPNLPIYDLMTLDGSIKNLFKNNKKK